MSGLPGTKPDATMSLGIPHLAPEACWVEVFVTGQTPQIALANKAKRLEALGLRSHT